jgi:gas vesicle protein
MAHHHDNDGTALKTSTTTRAVFFSGVFWGGLVGVAVGLLLAPAAGQATRHKLRAQAVSARDQALEAVEDVRAQAEDIQKTGREMLEENKRRIVRTAEAVKYSAQEAWANEDEQGEPQSGPTDAEQAMPSQDSSMYNLMEQIGAGQTNPGPARNDAAARA